MIRSLRSPTARTRRRSRRTGGSSRSATPRGSGTARPRGARAWSGAAAGTTCRPRPRRRAARRRALRVDLVAGDAAQVPLDLHLAAGPLAHLASELVQLARPVGPVGRQGCHANANRRLSERRRTGQDRERKRGEPHVAGGRQVAITFSLSGASGKRKRDVSAAAAPVVAARGSRRAGWRSTRRTAPDRGRCATASPRPPSPPG